MGLQIYKRAMFLLIIKPHVKFGGKLSERNLLHFKKHS